MNESNALDELMAAYAKHRDHLRAAAEGGNVAMLRNYRESAMVDLHPPLEALHQALTTRDAA